MMLLPKPNEPKNTFIGNLLIEWCYNPNPISTTFLEWEKYRHKIYAQIIPIQRLFNSSAFKELKKPILVCK